MGKRWSKTYGKGAAVKRVAAEPFRPHTFETTIEHLNVPKTPLVLITPSVYTDMLAIAQHSGSDEIGWLGTVTQLTEGSYLIDSIYFPKQEVSGTTTVLTEDGLGELFTNLAATNPDACDRMKFWGHVHPSNSTNPSAQDDEQMAAFAHNDWFIRGIFGRYGRAEFTFFHYKNGIVWNDVPWTVMQPVDKDRDAFWADQVKEKVTDRYQYVHDSGPVTPVSRVVISAASDGFDGEVVGGRGHYVDVGQAALDLGESDEGAAASVTALAGNKGVHVANGGDKSGGFFGKGSLPGGQKGGKK